MDLVFIPRGEYLYIYIRTYVVQVAYTNMRKTIGLMVILVGES